MSIAAQKPALLVDVAGTLVFSPPEGTPTSGTVVIHDENGAVAELSAAGTVVGATLTRSILAATLDTVAPNYRALWTYVVAGVTYIRGQLFDVVAYVVTAPLGEVEFLERYPLLTTRYPRGQTTFAAQRSQGWERVVQAIELGGLKPNRIMDSTPFVAAQAHFAAAAVFRNLGAGSADTDAWQAMARDADAAGVAEMQARLANLYWYDTDESLTPGGGETNVDNSGVLVTR